MKIFLNTVIGLVATFCLGSLNVCAQNTTLRVFADGNNVRAPKGEMEVQGSVFLNEKWLPGKVVFVNGESGLQESLNFDVMDNLLVTKRNNQEMMFDQPIKEFTIKDGEEAERTFRKVNDKFYEVIYDGTTKVLKLHSKASIQSTAYGASKPTLKISDEQHYFLVDASGEFKQFKRDKTLVKLLPKNVSQVENFVKKEAVNFKRDQDLAKLLAFYDSL